MEARLGHDFSRVRVHADEKAADSARAVDARAYTFGRDIVFGTRQYAPGTVEGRGVLAHELTHVAQQNDREAAPPPDQIKVGPSNSIFEQEAEIAAGQTGPAPGKSEPAPLGPVVQRIEFGEKVARFFGGGTFTEDELQAYLKFLDDNNRIEDTDESDNKARIIVGKWKKGDALYLLPGAGPLTLNSTRF
jgi:hypothetical protein